MAAHTISVTPEQLRTQARVYTEAREMIEEANNKVRNMNNQIAEQWRGKAFESYLNQYEELNKHVVEFKNLLTSINQQLDKYANEIAARDVQDARSFGLQ